MVHGRRGDLTEGDGGTATRRAGDRDAKHPRGSAAAIEAARRTIARLESQPDAVAAAARMLFEAGAFDAARAGYARAFADGHSEPETVVALQTLLADAGDHAAIAALIGEYLNRVEAGLAPVDQLTWCATLFDELVTATAPEAEITGAAIRFLETAAASGDAGWDVVLEPRRRALIEAAFPSAEGTLARLEQESYAPVGTGLPALAVARAEEIGHRHAAAHEVARAAERLLHRLGEREAAYRVEASRRATRDGSRSVVKPCATPPRLSRAVILVAGGHAALQAAVVSDLRGAGVGEVRSLLPSWETSRSARTIREHLRGVDLAVLIVRQLDHGTSGTVRSVAAARGIPVAVAHAASVGAVRAAVGRLQD